MARLKSCSRRKTVRCAALQRQGGRQSSVRLRTYLIGREQGKSLATAVIKRLNNYSFGTVIPFILLHAGCVALFFVPFRWSWVGLMLAMYVVRMFGITAGYHRYFSHRTYKLARGWQFLIAFLAETSGQKGVLW